MKKTLIICTFALALLSVSCNKERMDVTEPDVQSQTFTAVREDFEKAKADLIDQKIEWEIGDEISISDGTVQSVFVATKVDEETGVATFSLKDGQTPLAEEGVTYKAWYPAGIAPKEGVAAMPQQQATTNGLTPEGKKINYAPSKFSALPMYCESTTTTLSFKNLCALVKISLATPGDDIAVSQVILESDDKATWGPYSIAEGKMTYSGEVADFGRAAVRNTNAKWISAVPCYYFAIPEGTYNSLEIIVQDNKKQTQIKSLQKALSVERNHIYNVDFAIDNLRNDLSYARQTANCYAVAAAQKNCFRATRGNETSIIEGIDHVGIVWRAQSAGTTDLTNKVVKDNVSYDVKTGYVEFESTGNQGNALIAAYDASGKVLWSWHIWVLNSARPLADVTVGGTTMLDRNLGALYTAPYAEGSGETSVLTAGYCYQWGRKDPFPGRGYEGSTGAMVKMLAADNTCMDNLDANNRPNTHPMTDANAQITVQESVENPEKFVPAGSQHWASDIADTWGGETKTIYDPCPYGYRVPAAADFTGFWSADYVLPYESANKSGNTAVHGFNYTVEDATSFFAVTGQIGTNGKMSGAYIGSNSSASSAAVQGYSRIWTRESDHTFIDAVRQITKGKAWDNRTTVIRTSASINSYGMAVRCVRENTEAENNQ